MAVWFLANAAANKMAGVLSALYPDPSKPAPYLLGFEISGLYEFFMLFVCMSGVASIILFAITKYLQRMMHTTE
jgi:POT family proton-dependent oligopeptide transporter